MTRRAAPLPQNRKTFNASYLHGVDAEAVQSICWDEVTETLVRTLCARANERAWL